MSPAAFDRLPYEILEAIASLLDSKDLICFTLLNKACYSAALPHIFSSIGFRINEQDKLKRDISGLVRALERADAFKHVRNLEIFGEWRTDDNPLVKFPGENEYQPWVANHHVAGQGGETVQLRWQADFAQSSKTYEDDAVWQPLADLLVRLPRLEDFIYECPHQLSLCLLERLHLSLPTCRLHLRCFRLRSLLDGKALDSYEQQLATSPNLSTIFTSFELFYEDYFADFGYKTIVKVASGVAPNLKEVRVNNFVTSNAVSRHACRAEFRPTPRKYEFPDKVSPKGALEVLELHGYEHGRGSIDIPCIELWDASTDFARLRRLRLGQVEEEILLWATKIGPFRDLTALTFCAWPRHHRRLHHTTIPAFLQSLPALKELEMIGDFCRHDLDAVITASGSLRRLHPDSEVAPDVR
ncbi:hypothetical protein M409DRAFT_61049 [Zasmidium cellare ATCC 36951]|uniref:F-box domain-containing protein n=1 Tax=Zasmidium cellare ATCC 36951 TaxID=1080233 RepID=A0A6A6BZ87_ZASCE|nr:uncharacterized protein M409DRAFT_61049 [Zasmidium cellare ATCC 36951]KAF2159230.1 hypothetical protein M409DRAFT_61049 [Zasmidium cellare ATCC 36951]